MENENPMRELSTGLGKCAGGDKPPGDIPFEEGLKKLIDLINERAAPHVDNQKDNEMKRELAFSNEAFGRYSKLALKLIRSNSLPQMAQKINTELGFTISP